jgi:DNA-binding transcriptional LysR family regulator
MEILAKWRPPHYPFYVVYPQNRHVTQRLRVFIAWLAEVFPEAVKG